VYGSLLHARVLYLTMFVRNFEIYLIRLIGSVSVTIPDTLLRPYFFKATFLRLVSFSLLGVELTQLGPIHAASQWRKRLALSIDLK
jgi:hypothetical protein